MPKLASFRQRVRRCVLRWSIKFREMEAAPRILIVGSGALLFVATFLWRHFGTATSLPVLADLTPILLAMAGIIMSYVQPKKENHGLTTLVLIFAGLCGSGVLTAARMMGESQHKSEVQELNKKLDAVGKQNTDLANMLLKAAQGTMTEAQRRTGIETTLRNKYILSHDPIDPEILAGNKMPPDDWMNQQLRELGQTWTVKNETNPRPVTTQIIQEAPEQKKAAIRFGLFEDSMIGDQVETVKLDPLSDARFTVSIYAVNTTDTPAEHVQIWIRRCKSCEWIPPDPPGMQQIAEFPYDRTTGTPEMLPHVLSQVWQFTIKIPNVPRLQTVPIGCYYACTNCSPVNWQKPQLLYVTMNVADMFRLQIPSVSDIPEPVH